MNWWCSLYRFVRALCDEVINDVRVAVTNLAATLEVMGSRPIFGDVSEIHFLESIQSPAQRDLKWYV